MLWYEIGFVAFVVTYTIALFVLGIMWERLGHECSRAPRWQRLVAEAGLLHHEPPPPRRPGPPWPELAEATMVDLVLAVPRRPPRTRRRWRRTREPTIRA